MATSTTTGSLLLKPDNLLLMAVSSSIIKGLIFAPYGMKWHLRTGVLRGATPVLSVVVFSYQIYSWIVG